jgi:thymidine kinase
MRSTRQNLSKKKLKIFEPRSDGRGGSKLLEKTYTPNSPKKTIRRSKSPSKSSPSKRQKTDDIHDFGTQEHDFFEEDLDSDPRQTKVSISLGVDLF